MSCVLYTAIGTVDVVVTTNNNAYAATDVVTTSNFVATIANDVATTPTAYDATVAHATTIVDAIVDGSLANMYVS